MKQISQVQDTIRICDSLVILPWTIELKTIGESDTVLNLEFRCIQNCIVLFPIQKALTEKNYQISYRTLFLPVYSKEQTMDSMVSVSIFSGKTIGYSIDESSQTQSSTASKIQYRGGLERSINFGNNQDASVNSQLNLKINGKINDQLELDAVISDRNLPVQADGTTVKIKEFDQIYITLKNNDRQLTAGDYQIQSQQGSFTRYQKKLKGGIVKADSIAMFTGNLSTQVFGAIAKGKNARLPLPVTAGNAGPYRLTGNNQEIFIIILSGSEKVYLDGVLLQRGAENDYTMDYNRAEILFTTKRIIKSTDRVVIEYEYAEQNYVKSTYGGEMQWKDARTRIYTSFISEQDAKNLAGDLQLTDEALKTLSQLGPMDAALVPSIRNYAGNGNAYEKIYQPNCSELDTILEYNNSGTGTLFSANFTDLGEGKGNYLIQSYNSQGPIYVYTPPHPITCQPTGRYQPVQRITPPEKKLLLSSGFETRLHPKLTSGGELVYHVRNTNAFSTLAARSDAATAFWLDWQLLKDSSNKKEIHLKFQHQWTGSYFTGFDPFRSTEYYRAWNYTEGGQHGEHLMEAKCSLRLKQHEVIYAPAVLLARNSFQGIQQQLQYHLQTKRLSLQVQDIFNQNSWNGISHLANQPKILGKWNIDSSAHWIIEWNGSGQFGERRSTNDSLLPGSIRFGQASSKISFLPGKKNMQAGMEYTFREDQKPQVDQWNLLQRSHTLAGFIQWPILPQWSLEVKAGYLKQWIPDSLNQTSLIGKQYWNGHIQQQFAFLKKAILWNVRYQLEGGKLPKVTYAYEQVPAGKGQFQWIDRNQDQVQQIDEFEIATSPDVALFIRFILPGNMYIDTRNQKLEHALQIEGDKLFSKSSILRKFTLHSIGSLHRTVPTVSSGGIFPFSGGDEITRNVQLDQWVYYQRNDPNWQWIVQWHNQEAQQALIQGNDVISESFQSIQGLKSWNKNWNLSMELKLTQKKISSTAFESRNFRIRRFEFNPSLQFLTDKNWNCNLRYQFIQQSGKDTALVNTNQHVAVLETSLIFHSRNRLNARVEWNYVQSDPIASGSPLYFGLLNELQAGNNFKWQSSWDIPISKEVVMTLHYEGRKTGPRPTIHWFTVQAKALF